LGGVELEIHFFQALSQNLEKRILVSTYMSVRPFDCNNSAATGRILIKFCIVYFFWKKLPRNYMFHLNLIRITGTLHEDLCTFMIISDIIFIRIRNVSGNFFRHK
jgi:hypothetical protein